jgi:hypothetical protein
MRNIFTTLFSLLFVSSFAQDRTTVNAMNSEISDNLDLRAVASIFGDSKNLEDFEYRLNDPKNQISNLDLNNDNQVDYLRVIESVEGRTHIIVVQSVLGRDLFQDVATVEVEKDLHNRIQVQVVGDVYMYGNNYIYEPIYVQTPIIYDYFWVSNYRPYCSTWYWGYYPTFYYAWNPFPLFRYRSHIDLCINFNHHYNYVNYRRCQVAYTNYYGRRANGYEREYPGRGFSDRHSGYTNRYELDRTRNIRTVGTRDAVASTNPRNNGVRNENSSNPRNNSYDSPRDNSNNTPRPNPRGNTTSGTPRDNSYEAPRSNTTMSNSSDSNPRDNANNTPRPNPRGNTSGTPRDNSYEAPRSNTTMSNSSDSNPRDNSNNTPRPNPRGNTTSGTPRDNSYEAPRSNTNMSNSSDSNPRDNSYSSPRGNTSSDSPRSNPRGNSASESPRGNGNSSSSSSSRSNSGVISSSRGSAGNSGSRR